MSPRVAALTFKRVTPLRGLDAAASEPFPLEGEGGDAKRRGWGVMSSVRGTLGRRQGSEPRKRLSSSDSSPLEGEDIRGRRPRIGGGSPRARAERPHTDSTATSAMRKPRYRFRGAKRTT